MFIPGTTSYLGSVLFMLIVGASPALPSPDLSVAPVQHGASSLHVYAVQGGPNTEVHTFQPTSRLNVVQPTASHDAAQGHASDGFTLQPSVGLGIGNYTLQ